MWFFLLIGLVFASDSSLLVRLDYRKAPSDLQPWVTLIYADGRYVSQVAVDEGESEADRFKGDDIWESEFLDAQAGRVRIVVTDGPPSWGLVPIAQRNFRVEESGVSKVQLKYKKQTQAEQSETDSVTEDERFPSFPLAAAALATPQPLSLSKWKRVRLMWGVLSVVLVGILCWMFWVRSGRLSDALSALGGGAIAPPLERKKWLSERQVHWLSVGILVVLCGVIWLPNLGSIDTHFLGIEYVDHYGTQWFYWFVEHHVLTGADINHTDLFFYPWGKDIFAHTGANVLDAYFALPLRVIAGHVLGYNLFVLLSVVGNTAAFYLLAREVSDDRFACTASSILFSLQPFLMLEFVEGRPTQGLVVLPVLFMVFVFRAGRQRGWKAPVFGGVLLAITGYQYWFYAVFGGIACLAHGLWRTYRPLPGAGLRWQILMRYAGMAGIAFLAASPTVVPMLVSVSSGENVPGLLDTELWSIFATPPTTVEELSIGIYSWQPFRRAMGFLVEDTEGNERFLAHTLALPWGMLLLLLAYLRRPGKFERGLFLCMFLSLSLVAMGPVIILGDWALPNPPYIYLIKAVRFLRRLWWPSRSIIYITMICSLTVTVVLANLGSISKRMRASVLGVVTVWWGLDLYALEALPFPVWNAAVPAGYKCFKGDDEGALIELPYAWTQGHLYFQTVHHRPILGGMLEDNPVFTPEEFTAFRTGNPMIRTLLAGDVESYPLIWDEVSKEEVYERGFRWVLLQKDAFYKPTEPEFSLAQLDLYQNALARALGDAVYDDGRVTVYSPWGTPLPCDVDNWPKDASPVGPTEQMQKVREWDPAKQIYQRLITKPDDPMAGNSAG